MIENEQTESNSKTRWVLAVRHAANKGKTETLREVANHLLQQYPNCIPIVPIPSAVPQTGDFRLVVGINGRRVAVESRGDPHTGLHDRLLDLSVNHGADVIICTARTKGDTVEAVEYLRATKGYEVIWTSTYQMDHQHNVANRTKAVHVVDLLSILGIL